MSSPDRRPLDSLERDLETTAEDVAALRAAAAHRPPDPFAAVQALIDALPPAARRPRLTTAEGRAELVLWRTSD